MVISQILLAREAVFEVLQYSSELCYLCGT